MTMVHKNKKILKFFSYNMKTEETIIFDFGSLRILKKGKTISK